MFSRPTCNASTRIAREWANRHGFYWGISRRFQVKQKSPEFKPKKGDSRLKISEISWDSFSSYLHGNEIYTIKMELLHPSETNFSWRGNLKISEIELKKAVTSSGRKLDLDSIYCFFYFERQKPMIKFLIPDLAKSEFIADLSFNLLVTQLTEMDDITINLDRNGPELHYDHDCFRLECKATDREISVFVGYPLPDTQRDNGKVTSLCNNILDPHFVIYHIRVHDMNGNVTLLVEDEFIQFDGKQTPISNIATFTNGYLCEKPSYSRTSHQVQLIIPNLISCKTDTLKFRLKDINAHFITTKN